ncbi:MAG TPA: hypothetical protein PLR35_14390, partial [Burkholderiaceae bacterium]|nr:hypothetical protein [Burkholderiaceae bacterium]
SLSAGNMRPWAVGVDEAEDHLKADIAFDRQALAFSSRDNAFVPKRRIVRNRWSAQQRAD